MGFNWSDFMLCRITTLPCRFDVRLFFFIPLRRDLCTLHWTFFSLPLLLFTNFYIFYIGVKLHRHTGQNILRPWKKLNVYKNDFIFDIFYYFILDNLSSNPKQNLSFYLFFCHWDFVFHLFCVILCLELTRKTCVPMRFSFCYPELPFCFTLYDYAAWI